MFYPTASDILSCVFLNINKQNIISSPTHTSIEVQLQNPNIPTPVYSYLSFIPLNTILCIMMSPFPTLTFVELLISTILFGALTSTEGSPTNELRRKRQTIEEVGTKVGCLTTRLHQVTGEVYVINNSSQLYIRDFTFDGQGLGVYFYIGRKSLLFIKVSF